MDGVDALMSEDYPGQFDVVYRKYYKFDSSDVSNILMTNYINYRRTKCSDKAKNFLSAVLVAGSN